MWKKLLFKSVLIRLPTNTVWVSHSTATDNTSIIREGKQSKGVYVSDAEAINACHACHPCQNLLDFFMMEESHIVQVILPCPVLVECPCWIFESFSKLRALFHFWWHFFGLVLLADSGHVNMTFKTSRCHVFSFLDHLQSENGTFFFNHKSDSTVSWQSRYLMAPHAFSIQKYLLLSLGIFLKIISNNFSFQFSYLLLIHTYQ